MQHPVAVEVLHRLEHAFGLRPHADRDLGKRRGLEHLAVLVENVRPQQQARRLVGPEPVAVPVAVFRLDEQHVGRMAGHALLAAALDLVPVGDAVVPAL